MVLDHNKFSEGLSIYLSEAFSTVNHVQLVDKLERAGIRDIPPVQNPS